MSAADDRARKSQALENTGSRAQRVAAIQGRVMKADLRKAAETSKANARRGGRS